MRIPKTDIPIKAEAPTAVARQKTGFGDASDYGSIGAEHFRMDAGTDLAPLLKGLEKDLCQAPHWGYLIDGKVTTTYEDGSTENLEAGDLFYWPPGHTVRSDTDSEFVLFSPEKEHTKVLNHVKAKIES